MKKAYRVVATFLVFCLFFSVATATELLKENGEGEQRGLFSGEQDVRNAEQGNNAICENADLKSTISEEREQVYTSNSDYRDEWMFYRTASSSNEANTINMIGFPGSVDQVEHDHYSIFGKLLSHLGRSEFGMAGLQESSLMLEEDFCDILKNSNVFVVHTHGGVGEDGSYINLYDAQMQSATMPKVDSNYFSEQYVDLQMVELIIFGACQSGQGRETGNNLVNAAHNVGAKYAVGFTSNVECIGVNVWINKFLEKLEMQNFVLNDATIEAAAVYATEEAYAAGLRDSLGNEYSLEDNSMFVENYYINGIPSWEDH